MSAVQLVKMSDRHLHVYLCRGHVSARQQALRTNPACLRRICDVRFRFRFARTAVPGNAAGLNCGAEPGASAAFHAISAADSSRRRPGEGSTARRKKSREEAQGPGRGLAPARRWNATSPATPDLPNDTQLCGRGGSRTTQSNVPILRDKALGVGVQNRGGGGMTSDGTRDLFLGGGGESARQIQSRGRTRGLITIMARLRAAEGQRDEGFLLFCGSGRVSCACGHNTGGSGRAWPSGAPCSQCADPRWPRGGANHVNSAVPGFVVVIGLQVFKLFGCQDVSQKQEPTEFQNSRFQLQRDKPQAHSMCSVDSLVDDRAVGLFIQPQIGMNALQKTQLLITLGKKTSDSCTFFPLIFGLCARGDMKPETQEAVTPGPGVEGQTVSTDNGVTERPLR